MGSPGPALGCSCQPTPPTPTSSTSAPKCQETRDPGWEARKAARGLLEAGRLTVACLSSSWPSSVRFSWKEDPWDVKSTSSGEGSNDDPGGVARVAAGLGGRGAYPAWLSPRGTRWMALCSPHLVGGAGPVQRLGILVVCQCLQLPGQQSWGRQGHRVPDPRPSPACPPGWLSPLASSPEVCSGPTSRLGCLGVSHVVSQHVRQLQVLVRGHLALQLLKQEGGGWGRSWQRGC